MTKDYENITKADYDYWVSLDKENRKRRKEITYDMAQSQTEATEEMAARTASELKEIR